MDLFPLEINELTALIKARRSGREYELLHRFENPTEDDWIEYEKRAAVSVAKRGDELRGETDIWPAIDWLWRRRIKSVEGYGELPEGWHERVPMQHKNFAVSLLCQVGEWRPEEELDKLGAASLGGDYWDLDGETVTVCLEAARNGERYHQLYHIFRRPTAEQQLRYRRARNQTVMVTGRKSGEIVERRLPELPALLKLYGELIDRVEGYSPAAPEKMDAMHKQAAVLSLMEGNA